MMFALALALALATPLALAAPAPTPAVPGAALPAGLDATLHELAGSAPVTGTLTIDQTSITGSGAKAKHSTARITFDVSAARGVSLQVPGAVLAQAEQQIAAHQRDPELPTPAADLLGGTNLVQVQRMLDPAAALRAELIGARLLRQSSTTLDGVPATLLRFDLPLVATASERKMVQHYQATLSLWLNAQGAPLGFTRSTRTEVGWFLLHADTRRSERGRFQIIDGRLITTRLDVQQDGSALGHHGSTTTDYVLRIAARAATPAAHADTATGA
ncbi:MAG: hypothetical protein M0P72_05755 [Metallibacterium scheffleri]|jgi:hypothetical protein|uniref:hypothetical protein n=1 Tax=Metallibacterium scheffleri TaxID=993689 RepID=UPI0026EEAC58|nr:hypothetical protein [Metallibacterium scheffleri]MCK9366635.1 hypothetical protein [Metallibacterium scheffleri]